MLSYYLGDGGSANGLALPLFAVLHPNDSALPLMVSAALSIELMFEKNVPKIIRKGTGNNPLLLQAETSSDPLQGPALFQLAAHQLS